MSEENKVVVGKEDKKVSASRVVKGRKSICAGLAFLCGLLPRDRF